MGPLLGGWITDNINWPWIFYINIPVGIVAALASWAIYRKRESATRKLPIDTVGLALLVRLDRRACRSCSTWARSTTGSIRAW